VLLEVGNNICWDAMMGVLGERSFIFKNKLKWGWGVISQRDKA